MPSCVESSRSPVLASVCYFRSDDVGVNAEICTDNEAIERRLRGTMHLR